MAKNRLNGKEMISLIPQALDKIDFRIVTEAVKCSEELRGALERDVFCKSLGIPEEIMKNKGLDNAFGIDN